MDSDADQPLGAHPMRRDTERRRPGTRNTTNVSRRSGRDAPSPSRPFKTFFKTRLTPKLARSSSRAPSEDAVESSSGHASMPNAREFTSSSAINAAITGPDEPLEQYLRHGEYPGYLGPPCTVRTPIFILYMARDPRIPETAVCAVTGHIGTVQELTKNQPSFFTEHTSVESAWNAWESGWEEGLFAHPIHPESIWPRVVSRGELERRRRAERINTCNTAAHALLQLRNPPEGANGPPTAASCSGTSIRSASSASGRWPVRAAHEKIYVVIRGAFPGFHFNLEQFLLACGTDERAWGYAATDHTDANDFFDYYNQFVQPLPA
ncbi:hypothetical protein NM688_g7530 [Phlebia brevispora]|uniref:Uncharacterized protein n=1 Tax=Phlebia brevispora TaxID=194682 RepID=A0ACC1S449_9APHY|nr:hypothetical protein NM688_g7530 [Phlebia brevispora]